MSQVLHDAEYYRRAFYELLPSVYRRKDLNAELRRFSHVFAEEIARMRQSADQLWRDLYIETCQEWVVPYIGDLVGTNLLTGDAAEARLDVLNTIRWRQMKGTLAVLQETGEVMWQSGAAVAEMFERLAWSQHLQYRRPGAIAWFDFTDPVSVSRLRSPFATSGHTVDLRQPSDVAGQHFHSAIATHLSMSHAFVARRVETTAVDAARHRFSPSNVDTALLIANPMEPNRVAIAPNADAAQPGWEQAPLRNADFALHEDAYFGSRAGFTLFEDGIPLCASVETATSSSLVPLATFGELRSVRGIILADPLLHAGLADGFDVRAMRILPLNPATSSLVPFDQNYALDGAIGVLDTTGGYTPGAALAPNHEPAALLRIERNGADATFPESELILQNGRGAAVLVHIDEVVGLGAGPLFLYVADDGSTYFARSDLGQGLPDLNPDSGEFGAFLPVRRSRSSDGQVRPRPGLRPVTHRSAIFGALCCWEQPLQQPPLGGQVAFDPELGRFVFPVGEVPGGELTATYGMGRGAAVGAVERVTPTAEPATRTVGRLVNADHTTIQAAVDALADGAVARQIVEIVDSGTYIEAVSLAGRSFPGGLSVRAGLGVVPTLRSPGGAAFGTDAACQIDELTIEGLTIEVGGVEIEGDIPALGLVRTTVDPATSGLRYEPAPSAATLRVERAIVGETQLGVNVGLARFEDSVLQHPEAEADAAGGFVALLSPNELEFERTTILGDLQCAAILLSNSIHCGIASVVDADRGCARYSRYDEGSDIGRAFRSTTVVPILVDSSSAHPGHVQLHPKAASELLDGAEEGGVMGVHYSAARGWRAQNVLRKHQEYAPAGTRPQVVRRAALNRKIWIPKL